MNAPIWDTGMVQSLVNQRLKGINVSNEEREDIVQDVLLKAIERSEYYDPAKCSERGFLAMLVNDVVWKKSRSTDALDLADVTLDGAVEGDDGENISAYEGLDPDKLLNAENNSFYQRNKQMVDEAINRLSEPYASIVHFKLIYGYTHEEIAQILSLSVDASKKAFGRGVTMLAEAVGKSNEEARRKTKRPEPSAYPQLDLTTEEGRAEYSEHLDKQNEKWARHERNFYLTLAEMDKQYEAEQNDTHPQ